MTQPDEPMTEPSPRPLRPGLAVLVTVLAAILLPFCASLAGVFSEQFRDPEVDNIKKVGAVMVLPVVMAVACLPSIFG